MPGGIIFLSLISFKFTKYTSRCLQRFSIHPSNKLSQLQETKTINCTRADGTLCIARQKEIPHCKNFNNFRFTGEISCFFYSLGRVQVADYVSFKILRTESNVE